MQEKRECWKSKREKEFGKKKNHRDIS